MVGHGSRSAGIGFESHIKGKPYLLSPEKDASNYAKHATLLGTLGNELTYLFKDRVKRKLLLTDLEETTAKDGVYLVGDQLVSQVHGKMEDTTDRSKRLCKLHNALCLLWHSHIQGSDSELQAQGFRHHATAW